MSFERSACIIVHCDGCDEPLKDEDSGAIWHFEDEVKALAEALESGWLQTAIGIVCNECVISMSCELIGHDWRNWQDLVTDTYIGRSRHCRRCPAREMDPDH